MLVLARGVYDDVIGHARRGAPEEVCGVLGGRRGERSRATSARAVGNVAADPQARYELDPEAQLGVMEEIEAAGEDVVGFYHSHPAGPPHPSRTDERQATWAGYTYAIVALDGEFPYLGAWRWTGERFEREPVAVSPGSASGRE